MGSWVYFNQWKGGMAWDLQPAVSSELQIHTSCDSLETLLLTPIYQSESQKISAKWVSWQQHKKKIKNDLSVSIYALLMSQPRWETIFSLFKRKILQIIKLSSISSHPKIQKSIKLKFMTNIYTLEHWRWMQNYLIILLIVAEIWYFPGLHGYKEEEVRYQLDLAQGIKRQYIIQTFDELLC